MDHPTGGVFPLATAFFASSVMMDNGKDPPDKDASENLAINSNRISRGVCSPLPVGENLDFPLNFLRPRSSETEFPPSVGLCHFSHS